MNQYKGDYLSQISFPLGGIGSGCIGLAGNGSLVDWELFHHPNRMSINEFSGFAIKAENESEVVDMRVLQGDTCRDFIGGTYGDNDRGWNYGTGVHRGTLAGLKHFRDLTFTGEFPVAELHYADEQFPGEVTMTAFNPFIPGNDKDSSLPAAFMDIEITNTTDQPLSYTAACMVGNPFEAGRAVHQYRKKDDVSMMKITALCQKDDLHYGEFITAADCEDIGYQEYWFRGGWFDNLTMFINDFGSFGPLKNRHYDQPKERHHDVGMLTGRTEIRPGESRHIRFLLSWYVPNAEKYWIAERPAPQWKTYYATIFESAEAVAEYCMKNWERLFEDTQMFRHTLMDSTLPAPVLDAIQGNLAILKSSTCMRLEDGSFYGWEGVSQYNGSCEGTCQHVWNYTYALPFLFPNLERQLRTNELTYNMEESGLMHFRTCVPLGSGFVNFRACVDGQMGTVMRIYREWKISGDTEWLKKCWNRVKMCISYAWDERNKDRWDPEKSGVITGRQHHTLDVELFGVNSWLSGFYLGALAAASQMAEALGDMEAKDEYEELFEKGKARLDETFDEKCGYYVQQIDITDQSVLDAYEEDAKNYWDDELGQLKYQIDRGCEIDMVTADWHTQLMGLPRVFDPAKRKKTVASVYRNNFISTRENNNACRVFGCNDEKGLLICAYPKGIAKPLISIPYTEEFMTGYEYASACQMLQTGMEEEAIEVVAAIRERYDGKKRNPWSEIECGASYSRAMASYAFLLTYSGFIYDMTKKQIGFKPIHPGKYFWSLDGVWGQAECGKDALNITVLYGEICVEKVVHNLGDVTTVTVNGSEIPFTKRDDVVCIQTLLHRHEVLSIR